MRKQVLRGSAFCRDDLLNRERTVQEKTQVVFNLTYYSVFKDVREILKELHLLLTPDKAHEKVFSEVSIIGFKNAKLFYLNWIERADLNHVMGQIEKAESEETFDILKGPLACNSNNAIYLLECKKCQFKFSYVGSRVTKF